MTLGHDPDTCEECKREKEREDTLMRDEPETASGR